MTCLNERMTKQAMTETTRERLHKRPRKISKLVKRVTAAAAAGALAVAGFALAAPASAASIGHGVGEQSGGLIGWQGNMVTSDGSSYVYCTDPGTQFPSGGDTSQGYVTSWKGVSGNRLAGVNRILNETNAQSDTDAAAVNFVIKNTFDPGAMYQSHNYPGNGTWPTGNLGKYIEWVLSTTYPNAGGGWQTIRDRALQLQNIVDTTTAGSGGSGSGSLAFDVLASNNYSGTVTMQGTAGSTGTITLTNGIFLSTGTATLTGAQANTAYEIRGVPTEDGKPYKISGTGQFTPPGTAGYRAEIALWTNPNQSMAAKGRMASPSPFDVSGSDPMARSATFQPVLTSQAASFTDAGDLVDMLTFATAADADGLNNSWAQRPNGTYREVGFKITAYGPYPAELREVDDAPADAPVAGSTTVLAAGPVDPATVRIPGVSDAGYYTFVAEYDPTITPAATKAFLPADYSWKHAFGMTEETTVAPMSLNLSSQIADAEIPLSGRGDDTVVVESDGYWLQQRGGAGKVPVVLTGEYIYWPASAGDVAPTDTLPQGAQVVGTVQLTVTGAGRYKASDATGYDQLHVPAVGEGSMTWRWSVRSDAQREDVRGFVTETSELIGEPTQTQIIGQPELSTQAQPSATPGTTMVDVATVGGTLPADGLNLSFTAYNVPFGEDGQPVWPEGTQPGDYSGFCTEDNLVYTNTDSPQLITTAGDYTSPEVTTTSYAMTLWVERAASVTTGETIAEGKCGIPTETTYTGKVTTQAQTTSGKTIVKSGEQVWDTALLEGAVPAGGTIEVHLYQWKNGADAVCTDKTLVWSSKPVALDGGMFPKGLTVDFKEHGDTYTLPAVSADTNFGFIETTKDAEGRIVSQGKCGEPSETVTVEASKLAITGGDDAQLTALLAGGGALLALGAITIITAAVIRRRKETV